MQTDEYTISLSRELAVCRSEIKSLLRILAAIEREQGLTTERFLEQDRRGAASLPDSVAASWRGHVHALGAWIAREREYTALFQSLRR